MPELPPVAAAALVAGVLVAIIGISLVVRIRSRRRGIRLAQMVRNTAPIPRPSMSIAAEPHPEARVAPLRGRAYPVAGQEGRFQPFEGRPAPEVTPGRPARRLADHVTALSRPSPPLAADRDETPRHAASHAGLGEVVLSFQAQLAPSEPGPPALPVSTPPVEEPRPAGAAAEADVAHVTPSPEMAPAAPEPTALPVFTLPVEDVWPTVAAVEVNPIDLGPEPDTELASPAPEPAALPVFTLPVEEPQPVLAAASADEDRVDPAASTGPAEREWVAARPSPASVGRPREPRITVLPPRPAMPAFPAMMTREVSLADAARALQHGLTMTDGKHLRQAIAVGAATSVLVAAYAIRNRRR